MTTPKPKLKPKLKREVQSSSVPLENELTTPGTTQATPESLEKGHNLVEPVPSPKEKKRGYHSDSSFGLGKMKELQEAFKKAEQVQEGAKKLQEELEQMEIEADAGGGRVLVVINGANDPLRVTIAPEAIADGAEVLSDLVLEAWSIAYKKARASMLSRLEELTGIDLDLLGMR